MVQLGGLSDDILSQILESTSLYTATLWSAGDTLLNKKIERCCRVVRTMPSMRTMKMKKMPRMLAKLVSLQVLEVEVESVGERIDKLSKFMRDLNRGLKELSMTFLYASAIPVERFGFDFDAPIHAYPRIPNNEEGSFDTWQVGQVYPELVKAVFLEPEGAEENDRKWFYLSALSSQCLSIFPPSLLQLDWTAQHRYDIHFSLLPKNLQVLNFSRTKRRTFWNDKWLQEDVERDEEEEGLTNQSSLHSSSLHSSSLPSSSSSTSSAVDKNPFFFNTLPPSSSSPHQPSSSSRDWSVVSNLYPSHQRRRSVYSLTPNTISDARVVASFPRSLIHLEGVSVMAAEHLRHLPSTLRSGSWLPHEICHEQPFATITASYINLLPKSTISIFTTSFDVDSLEKTTINASNKKMSATSSIPSSCWASALPRSLTELKFTNPALDPRILSCLPKTLTCLYGVTIDSKAFKKYIKSNSSSSVASPSPIHMLWPPRITFVAFLKDSDVTSTALKALPPSLTKFECSSLSSSSLLADLPPSLTEFSMASYAGSAPSQEIINALPSQLRVIKVYSERPSQVPNSVTIFSFKEKKS